MPRKRCMKSGHYDNYFPKTLRGLMDERNITQRKLAQYIGVAPQTVGYYCSGSAEPGFDKLVKIAEFFNVTADYLLGTKTESVNRERELVKAATGLSDNALDTYSGIIDEYPTAAKIIDLILLNGNLNDIIRKIFWARSYFWDPLSLSCETLEALDQIGNASDLMSASAVQSFGEIVHGIVRMQPDEFGFDDEEYNAVPASPPDSPE